MGKRELAEYTAVITAPSLALLSSLADSSLSSYVRGPGLQHTYCSFSPSSRGQRPSYCLWHFWDISFPLRVFSGCHLFVGVVPFLSCPFHVSPHATQRVCVC